MRSRTFAFLLIVVLAGGALLVAQQQPAPPAATNPPAQAPPADASQPQATQKAPTIPIVVNLVDVLFTVLDRRNKLVSGLEQADFRVLDDNQPQDIRYFSKQSDLPLRI